MLAVDGACVQDNFDPSVTSAERLLDLFSLSSDVSSFFTLKFQEKYCVSLISPEKHHLFLTLDL